MAAISSDSREAPFQPGDVVVCVDNGPYRDGDDGNPELILNGFYRLSRTGVDPDDGEQLVIVAGTVPQTRSGWYGHHRFRKIEAPKTEIAARIHACKPAKVSA